MDKRILELKIASYGEHQKPWDTFAIAEHYFEGDIEEGGKDLDRALEWYLRVCEKEPNEENEYYQDRSFFQIGRIYFERGDYTSAVHYLSQCKTEPNDQVSLLACCYLYGLGVPQDLARGKELLQNGQCMSLAYLAGLYELGEIFPKDEEQAEALYTKAFSTAVQVDLYNDSSFLSIFEKVDEAADRGNLQAQLALGEYFFSEPWSFDIENSMLSKGQRNWACGAYWMLRAKEQGSKEAEKALEIFEDKRYKADAAEKAASIYARERKEKKGFDAVICARAEAYLKGFGPFWIPNEAIFRAAELGNAEAQYYLAMHNGDMLDALDFLARAAKQGHEGALEEFQRRGIPVDDPQLDIPPEGELSPEAQQTLLYRRSTLVAGNRRLRRILFSSGYGGYGGSNNSSYETESSWEILPEKLNGRRPYEVFKMRIAAVVNDIVYLVQGNHIEKVTFKNAYEDRFGVAYDTYEVDCIFLSDKEKD